MDERVLPFGVPYVDDEAEEAIAVLGLAVDGLLDDHLRAVAALRARAARYSRGVFALAFLSALLFLMQDFERAPVLQIVALGLVPVALLLLGQVIRTRWIEAERFPPPQVTLARKLSWEWVAIPASEERLLLWDTLSDEGVALALPAAPPKRKTWLFEEAFSPFETLTEEKRLILDMALQLESWRKPFSRRRLPVVASQPQAILAYLLGVPPHSPRPEPAPVLAGPRPAPAGLEDVEALLRLYQKVHIFLRRLAAWEEALPVGRRSVVSALAQTRPDLEPPPPLPEGHPMGAVESLLRSLDVVRSRALTPLQARLSEELEQMQSQRDRELGVIEQDWQRERTVVATSNDTLIQSLRRQVVTREGETLPEAERALAESEARLASERQRVEQAKRAFAERRKELAMLAAERDDAPHASDARRAQLSSELTRLETTIQEGKRSVAMWIHVVEGHRGAVQRVRRDVQSLKEELTDYIAQQERELREIENRFTTQERMLNARFGPEIGDMEADLTFLGAVHAHLGDRLKPHRTDLAMGNVKERAYTQAVQEADSLLRAKQRAVQQWADAISAQIEQWREAAQRVVAAIDEHALPHGHPELQRFLVPVWYVETASTAPTMWPWQRGSVQEGARFIGPLVEDAQGRRLAVPGPEVRRMRPMPALQQRLVALAEGERGPQLREEARRIGKPVVFSPARLDQVARSTAMPRAMIEALRPAQGVEATPAPARMGLLEGPGDAFVDSGTVLPEDAWAEPPSGDASLDEDGWRAEGPATAPEVPS